MNAPTRSAKLLKGATGDWEIVVGLEVHAQVLSEAKLFSGAHPRSTAVRPMPTFRWWMLRCPACCR